MPTFNQQLRNVSHEARTHAIWAGEQSVTGGFKLLTGTGVVKLANSALEGTTSWSTYALGYVGLGLGLAVRAYILNRDHANEEENILDFYRREIAASRGVRLEAVGVEDMHKVAETVPALQDALDRNDRERNVRMGSWITAGLIAGSAILFVFVGGLALLPAIGLTPLAHPVALFLASIATSTAIFHTAKEVVETGFEHLFKTREPTAHDKIEALSHHASLRPDQVLDVFITANPGLDERIERENNGTSFARLTPEAREAMVREYDTDLGLRRLTADINSRQVRVQEILFAAAGRASGVPRLDAPPPDATQKLAHEIMLNSQRAQKQWQEGVRQGRQQLSEVSARVQETTHRMGEAYREGGVKRAFTAMVGKGGKDPEQSWEQYSAERGAGTVER